ncbi:MAG: hypothetical protein KKA60_00935 [Proteobacteria bacterium]|nr:hypothetical protein [Pseudomonadota bacterium]
MIQSPCLQCRHRENDKDEPPCDGCKLLAALQAEDSRRYREDIVYRAQVRGFPTDSLLDEGQTCRVPGCAARVLAKGLCSAHYQAARRRKLHVSVSRAPGKRQAPPAVPARALPAPGPRAASPERPNPGRKP